MGKCAKVPKVISNLHVSIFCDISLRLTNCSIFLQKCLPTYIFLHFVCPNAKQFEGPNTYKKKANCVSKFKITLPLPQISKLNCPSVLSKKLRIPCQNERKVRTEMPISSNKIN